MVAFMPVWEKQRTNTHDYVNLCMFVYVSAHELTEKENMSMLSQKYVHIHFFIYHIVNKVLYS